MNTFGSVECKLTSRSSLNSRARTFMTLCSSSALAMFFAAVIPDASFGQAVQEQRQSSVVVLSEDGNHPEKILDQLREKLRFLPEDQRNMILEQVEKSIDQKVKSAVKEQRIVVTAIDDKGKQGKDGEKVRSMTIVQSLGDKSSDNPSGNKAGFAFAQPAYRIGISVENPEGDEEDDDDDEEGDERMERNKRGLVVERVMEDSPASEAGVRKGDVIVKINGEKAASFAGLRDAVQDTGAAGKSMKLTIDREGKVFTVKVKPTKSENPAEMNLQVVPMEGQAGQSFRFSLPAELGTMQIIGGEELAKEMHGRNDSNAHGKEVAELKEEISELRQEMRELKKLLIKALEAAQKR